MKPRISSLLHALFLVLLLTPGAARADIRWHWEDSFSEAEQDKLTTWIRGTLAAVESLVAPLRFDVHIHFYRLTDRGEPVPWANTRRGGRQGVNFHVDPDYPLESFFADWTAPHELSHLLIPSLGVENSWFAEGFASYMQYQVMQHMGLVNAQDITAAYRERMDRAQAAYWLPETPFASAARELRHAGDYPVYYWGGAVYFLRADTALRRDGGRGLAGLLSEYVSCCRERDESLAGLVQALDRLAGTPLFDDMLQEFQSRPGFPEYSRLLETLALQLLADQNANRL